MSALHGGARPGSGRKPKSDKPADDVSSQFSDPLAYLVAVATGAAPGEALRVAAAKAALPFTTPRARAPVASPAPQKLRAKSTSAANAIELDEWNAVADAVRRRLKKERAAP